MKITKIYIAGKVTDLPYNEVQRKFEEAELKLQKLGYEVANPVKLVDQNKDWNIAMVECLHHLDKCDAIFLLPDWNKSKGAKIELRVALETELEIFTNFKQLEKL